MAVTQDEAWRDGRRRDHALLEDEMCSYTGLVGEQSPDVMDALVYSMHELLLGERTAQDYLASLQQRVSIQQQQKRGAA